MAIIHGTANQDTLTGTALTDFIYGYAGHDTIDGGAGGDQMQGGTGDDYYTVDNVGDVVFEAPDEGEDGVTSALAYYVLPANVEHLNFWAMASVVNVHGIGNALDNHIYGLNGNDILDGGAGADMLHGGLGNDTYYFDHVGDWTDEEAGEGYDTIYTTVLPAAFLQSGVERLVYTGTANVTITGSYVDNDITTDAGNDVIDGGEGKDVMRGGKGDDVYLIDSVGDNAFEQADEGIDTVRTKLNQQSLNPNVENMVFIGTGDFFGTGNGLANRIEGGAGNDTIYGGEGNDTLVGFAGDDSYWAENSGDMIVEAAGGGDDRVWVTAASYVLPANVERLTVYTDIGVHAVGNGLNNSISGRDGNDILNGAAGADHMVGHKGDDVYFIENSGDFITEFANEGFDTVNYYLTGSYTLPNYLEKLVYLGGAAAFLASGNGLDNVLITGGGNDTLNGASGADTMEGKGGNDSYFVDNAGDQVIEAAGEGVDTVYATVAIYIMPANVENLRLDMTFLAFTATGNALNNQIDGGYGNDLLDGGAGADILRGSGGDDVYVLDNEGDQVVEHGGNGTDEIRTSLGSRSDFSKMFVLPENIENLTGTSAGAQGVYGNAHDNVINMGAGGDLIAVHQGGNEVVNAGGGNDYVFYGDTLSWLDVNDGGEGFDTLGLLGNITHYFSGQNLTNFEKLAVYSSGGGAAMPNNYHLVMHDQNVAAGKNLMVVAQSLLAEETFTFDASAERSGSFNVRGGRGSDTITAGGGADQIWGGLGADQLRGGAGNDIFEYNSASESTNQSHDTILDFDFGDKINLKPMDADGNAANGNSKFVFIGNEMFSGKAGELRVWQSAEGWLVQGDVNGDGSADLTIVVSSMNGHFLTASDFYL